MWKHKLRMSKSTHLVVDFQDIAWYMSAVYFKTPDVQSFFSQFEHFEYSQLSVETFAFATDDDWEIDYHRKELICHHKTYRSQLFKIVGSKRPIPFDDLESTRKTFIEMKNGTKKVETDDWRNSQKNCLLSSRQVSSLEFPIPVTRWNLHTLHQERKQMILSQAQHQLRKASRVDWVRQDLNDDLVRRQPLLLRMNEQFSDELESGLDRAVEMEIEKSDKSKDRRPKGDDVDIAPSPDDERWEKVSKKPGNESLEPRRIAVPLPGSEAQALTPAHRKMIKRLDDKVELYKLHVKHYHMSPAQFRRRTSMLNLPDRIHEKDEEVYNTCRVCSMSAAPPPRAKISGIRASVFGDVIFVDDCEIVEEEEVCRTSCFGRCNEFTVGYGSEFTR